MTINIPEKFKKIISHNQKLHGALNIAFANFGEWLEDNKIEFFPEYTDHGINHINSVLATAENIISDDCFSLLTPDDVYVLCSAILLHDCAMHINREGLWDLLTNEQYNGIMLGFDNDVKWSERWEIFKHKVNRFSDLDWCNLYSEFREVSIPEVGSKSLDDNQKILIGDFVRQHHAAIAQLIANIGIPASSGPYKVLLQEFSYLNQLAGFIARSHNINLRSAVDILGSDKSRTHRDTHPAFLMGVLRIADYLQFKSDRTPKILFSTKCFCSPVSIREWKKHLSIISTNNYHPDEELLFVEAFPEDAETLNAIKKLLSGFQRELDESWAVAGEIYSRYRDLSNFGLIYRRVKSNIDNPVEYVSTNHKNYHPEVLAIGSENKKLFPLLIKPLYGDLAAVGVRELLQNAIDACNERHAAEQKKSINLEDVPYKINLTLDYNDNKFIIEDNGVGMDVDIISGYFLNIGASYRTSEVWKKKYSSNEKSYLPRTGKFGIGMLAGFLIGNKIEIHTKHVNEDSKSVRFSYEIDSDHIELRFISKDKTGTKLTVFTNEEKLNEIKESFNIVPNEIRNFFYRDDKKTSAWWYIFDSPKVIVTEEKVQQKNIIKQKYVVKKKDLMNSKIWNSIEDSKLDGYFWKISDRRLVFCNGIYIHESQPAKIILDVGLQIIELKNFEILFFDNSGSLPLSLTREKFLIDDFYESDKLKRDFINSFTNEIKEKLNTYSFSTSFIQKALQIKSKFFNNSRYKNPLQFIPLVFTSKGISQFICDEVIKSSAFVILDFISENQSRGLVYRDIFSYLEDERVGIAMVSNCDKNAESIMFAILTSLCNKIQIENTHHAWSGKDFIDRESQDYIGWLFLKKYDLGKIDKDLISHGENSYISLSGEKIIIKTINEEWVVLYNEKNNSNVPDIAEKIISKSSSEFMFSIIKPKMIIETDIKL